MVERLKRFKVSPLSKYWIWDHNLSKFAERIKFLNGSQILFFLVFLLESVKVVFYKNRGNQPKAHSGIGSGGGGIQNFGSFSPFHDLFHRALRGGGRPQAPAPPWLRQRNQLGIKTWKPLDRENNVDTLDSNEPYRSAKPRRIFLIFFVFYLNMSNI